MGLHFPRQAAWEGEYGTFGVLMNVVAVLPTMPLQMVFAQQTAKAAIATGRQHELAGMIRLVWLGTFVIWLVGRPSSSSTRQHPPGFADQGFARALDHGGVLSVRGGCRFLWHAARSAKLSVAGLVHDVERSGAVGDCGCGGVCRGWLCRRDDFRSAVRSRLLVRPSPSGETTRLWRTASAPFDWRGLLAQVIPLMVGFGAFNFFLADTTFVKIYFTGNETDAYFGAGTLSRAL